MVMIGRRVMGRARLDIMIEFATGELASGDTARVSRLVRILAAQHPDEKALTLCFALTSAASALEDVVQDHKTVSLAYKLAALVAADTLAVEALGRAPARAVDLLHFWRRVDPWFLTL